MGTILLKIATERQKKATILLAVFAAYLIHQILKYQYICTSDKCVLAFLSVLPVAEVAPWRAKAVTFTTLNMQPLQAVAEFSSNTFEKKAKGFGNMQFVSYICVLKSVEAAFSGILPKVAVVISLCNHFVFTGNH